MSYLRDLARFLHSYSLGEHPLAMFSAYCDESYSSDVVTTPVYVVAGFLGRADRWDYFHEQWEKSQREMRIEGIGCHASDCSNGSGEYRGMSVEQRNGIQRRLIGDIAASGLFGVVAVIDMNAYRRRRERFSAFIGRDDKKYNEAHVLAVRQCVQAMCDVSRDTDEEIAFMFDRNKEFGKRAQEWYDQDTKSLSVPYRQRLGAFAQSGPEKALGLQAADLLAYAAYREYSKLPSWQWREMENAVDKYILVSDEDYWKKIETELDKQQAQGSRAAK